MQLERLSEKMDSCLNEVLSLKRISANSGSLQVGCRKLMTQWTDGLMGWDWNRDIFFWELLMRVFLSFLDFFFWRPRIFGQIPKVGDLLYPKTETPAIGFSTSHERH